MTEQEFQTFLRSIRPADRKPMDARAFLCGYLNACECDGGLAVCV